LYIKAGKSFFNVQKEKLSSRTFAAEQDNLEDVKGFRGQACCCEKVKKLDETTDLQNKARFRQTKKLKMIEKSERRIGSKSSLYD
jgi:hypothetical protein